MKKQTNRKGFTLVELLVVIAIIGILATMLFGPISGAISQAQQTTVRNNIANIAKGYFQATMDGVRFDDTKTNAAGVAANGGIDDWATVLAEETGVADPNMWFGGNLQRPTEGSDAVETVGDLKDATTAFTVVAGLSPSLGSRASQIPVIWTKGAEYDSALKQWTSDVGDYAIVGFADGSVKDLEGENPFLEYGSRTKSTNDVKKALPSGVTILND